MGTTYLYDEESTPMQYHNTKSSQQRYLETIFATVDLDYLNPDFEAIIDFE